MKRLMVVGALGVTAAALMSTLGSVQVAAGKEPTTMIARAHDGSFGPTFEKPIFILVLGGDARQGNPEHVRTDSIHIIAIEPVSKRASMLGIPRDSYVDVAGHGKQKITAATFFGGPKLMVQTVEGLSGCHFDYYMLSSFVNFVHLVDDFGGVTFTVDKRYYEKGSSHIDLRPGVQVFTGTQALAWARNRHVGRPLGDFDRSRAQGQLIVAALAEARKDFAARPGTLLRNLATMVRNVKMDIPLAEALKLGLFAMRIDPNDAKDRNKVLAGHSATVDGASVVQLDPGATAQFQDICSDGVLGN